jgi:hypothetical protein
MQQFAYTTGKNATDSALIIDAMDLLYTGNLDGFCLVSSDSYDCHMSTPILGTRLYVPPLRPNAVGPTPPIRP